MFRFLTFGKVKNIEHSYISKLSAGVKKNEPLATVGQPSSCRLFSWYICSSKAHSSFNLYKAKEKLHTTSAQTYSGLSRRSTMTDYAQFAQKRFSQMYTYRGPAFQPINRRASMYSLSAVLSGYDTMKHLSQIACKRFSSIRSYRSVSTPLNRSVHMRPFSPALSRHNSKKGHAQIAWKRFSQIRSDRGPASLLLNRSTHVRFYSSAVSYRKIMTHSARITWKGSSQLRSYSGTIFVPSNRSIRAMILTLNKFYPVFSGILVSFIGAVAYTQRASADADEYLPVGNSLYMHAQDGHAYLTSIMLSVLEGFVLFVRAIYLGFLFAPTIVMGPFADSLGVEFRKKWLHIVRVTLEKAGPAFIKWGQWAATRPDLFPRDLCVELSKLHSKAPEHSFAYTKKTIEKAFGRKLTEIFDDFEEAPVASGSVAQVHRATLRFQYPGKQDKPIVVAVKVRHPGVSESIRKDFVIIHFFAKISSFIPKLKWLRLDESVQQFAVFMMSQVDLSREAAQLSRFIYNFRKSKHVSFPRPLYPLVHPAVLVETYEKGESVSRYIDDNDELEGSDRIKRALADIGTNALLKMLLEDNFIHADMHPGNILVRVAQDKPDQKQLFKPKPHVIFLDVGMTAELSRTDQLNLREFFKAVAIRDGRTAAECTLRFSKKQNCPNPVAFIEEVEKSFTFWGTEEGDVVHPAECMHELLEQVRRHKVNIDGNVCTVMVTTLVLEGWQRKLDPDYNVMHTLQTLLFKADWVEDLVYTINELI